MAPHLQKAIVATGDGRDGHPGHSGTKHAGGLGDGDTVFVGDIIPRVRLTRRSIGGGVRVLDNHVHLFGIGSVDSVK